jgi:hypothetical protein
MSKKIVWIDDYPDRESTAVDIGAEFINVRGVDVATKVEQLLNGHPPSLVILDHVLDKTTTSNPIFQKGSTIAEAIKEKWPACPVVGVTAARVPDIDRRTKSTYDALFPFHDFGKHISHIDALRKGFALIAKSDTRKLIELLKPPVDDMERLRAALPDDLKAADQDASVASRMYRWVERLLERPGLLLDSLWSATLLGLNEVGFQKITREFERAKYGGIFARVDDPRWWASRLTEILYRQCPPGLGEVSWHTGRRLPGMKKEHFSHCYSCRGDFPETVAYLDEVSNERRAMHLKHTVLHPRYKRELYSEDIRMMQER